MIDKWLSDYNVAFYYQPWGYLVGCYRQSKVVDG